MRNATRSAITLLSLLVTASLIAGCMGNDPTGVPPAPALTPAEAKLAKADSLLQAKQFANAMVTYEQAIALDSTLSKAYLGYARATSFYYGVSGASFIAELQDVSAGADLSIILKHSDDSLTARIQASTKIVHILGILADRDTLTRNFKYLDSVSSADPLVNSRKVFMTAYLNKGDLLTPGYRARERFPLSDRKVTYQSFVTDFGVFLMMKTLMDLYDLTPKGVYDSHDRILMNFLSTNGDLGSSGLSDLMETDTLLQGNVNSKILELQSGLGDLSQLLAYYSTNPDSGAENDANNTLDTVVTNLGPAVTFYQFGDRKDNDGDGCIDEEFVDSLDNDLDGFVDEDARLINGTGAVNNPGDQVNNDRNGLTDDAQENKVGSLIPTNSRNYILTFVAMYLQTQNEMNIQEQNTTWIMPAAHKDGAQMGYRVSLQADSLAIRLTPGQRPIPAQYASKLDSAKTLVGGCWRNY